MKTMFSLHLGAFLVLLIGLCSVSGQSTTAAPASTSSAPTNGSNYFYNATTTLLSLERKLPMNITVNLIDEKKGDDGKIVYTLGKPLASVNFPDAPKVYGILSIYIINLIEKGKLIIFNDQPFLIVTSNLYQKQQLQ